LGFGFGFGFGFSSRVLRQGGGAFEAPVVFAVKSLFSIFLEVVR
jgi:hypothetical protein